MENLKLGSIVCFPRIREEQKERTVRAHQIGNRVYYEKSPTSVTTAEKVIGMIIGKTNREYLIELGNYSVKNGFESSSRKERYPIEYLRCAKVLC